MDAFERAKTDAKKEMDSSSQMQQSSANLNAGSKKYAVTLLLNWSHSS